MQLAISPTEVVHAPQSGDVIRVRRCRPRTWPAAPYRRPDRPRKIVHEDQCWATLGSIEQPERTGPWTPALQQQASNVLELLSRVQQLFGGERRRLTRRRSCHPQSSSRIWAAAGSDLTAGHAAAEGPTGR